jgi:hypothetical protein
VLDPGDGVGGAELREVEAGAEVVALGVEHDGPDVRRRRREEGLEPADRGIVEGVALGRPREPQHGHRAVAVQRQRPGQQRRHGGGLAHSDSSSRRRGGTHAWYQEA